MKFKKLDHIGVVVDDLEVVKTFFLDFGLELEGEAEIEGEWVDHVVGMTGVKSSIAVLRAPDGGSNIELIKYHHPLDENGIQSQPPNVYGIRNIAYQVDDIDAVVAELKKKGMETFGAVQQYQNYYKLCYVHGPEGIILMLAEALQ